MTINATPGRITRVNTIADGDQDHPVLFALDDGGWINSWRHNISLTSVAVKFQRYDADATKLGGEEPFPVLRTGVHQMAQAMAQLDDGRVVMAVSNARGMSIRTFSEDLDALGPSHRVAGTGKEGVGEIDIAALPDGGYVLSWGQYLRNSREGLFMMRFDDDGDRVGPRVKITNANGNWYGSPTGDVQALRGGGWLVTFEGVEKISQIRYDENGNQLGEPVQVNARFTPDYAGASYPLEYEVAALADGGWIDTWRSYDAERQSYDVAIRRFSADGSTTAADVIAIEGDQLNPQPDVAALVDGGYILTWVNGFDLWMARYDAAGNVIGSPEAVSDPDYVGGIAQNPEIVALADGGWVISWQQFNADKSEYGILQRAYATDMIGTDAADTFDGSQRSEKITGGAGDDIIRGFGGADTLSGDSGNDLIAGNHGNDTLQGGEGADVFAFAKVTGEDVIVDFDGLGGDVIDLRAFEFKNFDAIETRLSQADQSCQIALPKGSSITLVSYEAAKLTMDDFLF